jgi:CheY-like chemotaxis protein
MQTAARASTGLRHDGSIVHTAADGHLALRQLPKHRYDVVLCDLRMPGLDGRDFYAMLSHQHAYLRKRVLFLTGDTLGAESPAFLEPCGQPWVYCIFHGCLPPSPWEDCHSVHVKPATQSMGKLPPSPREACHVDHGKVATQSRRSLPPSERSDAGR